jgi:hypothetical protein
MNPKQIETVRQAIEAEIHRGLTSGITAPTIAARVVTQFAIFDVHPTVRYYAVQGLSAEIRQLLKRRSIKPTQTTEDYLFPADLVDHLPRAARLADGRFRYIHAMSVLELREASNLKHSKAVEADNAARALASYADWREAQGMNDRHEPIGHAVE